MCRTQPWRGESRVGQIFEVRMSTRETAHEVHLVAGLRRVRVDERVFAR
jgi:hypothetical protein